jgi:hypothetical protein
MAKLNILFENLDRNLDKQWLLVGQHTRDFDRPDPKREQKQMLVSEFLQISEAITEEVCPLNRTS